MEKAHTTYLIIAGAGRRKNYVRFTPTKIVEKSAQKWHLQEVGLETSALLSEGVFGPYEVFLGLPDVKYKFCLSSFLLCRGHMKGYFALGMNLKRDQKRNVRNRMPAKTSTWPEFLKSDSGLKAPD